MKIYYINKGFEGDPTLFPWEKDITWDEVNLFITFDEKEPHKGKKCIHLGMNDAIVYPFPFYNYGHAPKWDVWKGPLSQSFFKRAIDVAFNI